MKTKASCPSVPYTNAQRKSAAKRLATSGKKLNTLIRKKLAPMIDKIRKLILPTKQVLSPEQIAKRADEVLNILDLIRWKGIADQIEYKIMDIEDDAERAAPGSTRRVYKGKCKGKCKGGR